MIAWLVAAGVTPGRVAVTLGSTLGMVVSGVVFSSGLEEPTLADWIVKVVGVLVPVVPASSAWLAWAV